MDPPDPELRMEARGAQASASLACSRVKLIPELLFFPLPPSPAFCFRTCGRRAGRESVGVCVLLSAFCRWPGLVPHPQRHDPQTCFSFSSDKSEACYAPLPTQHWLSF